MTVLALLTISCKNTKTTEPTPEEIEAQKVALADSVLAKIDEIADFFIEATSNGISFCSIELTENEKAIKPDYLLDPAIANQLVTKTQKVNAFAIYAIESVIRDIYNMPVDDVKEVMSKLAADINHPINFETIYDNGISPSEKVRQLYKNCKESGDLAYFWQFENAIMREVDYLLAKDTDLYFSHIPEDAMHSYAIKGWTYFFDAIKTLAPYDEEIAMVLNTVDPWAVSVDNEEITAKYYSTLEQTKESYRNNVFNVIEKRNALVSPENH